MSDTNSDAFDNLISKNIVHKKKTVDSSHNKESNDFLIAHDYDDLNTDNKDGIILTLKDVSVLGDKALHELDTDDEIDGEIQDDVLENAQMAADRKRSAEKAHDQKFKRFKANDDEETNLLSKYDDVTLNPKMVKLKDLNNSRKTNSTSKETEKSMTEAIFERLNGGLFDLQNNPQFNGDFAAVNVESEKKNKKSKKDKKKKKKVDDWGWGNDENDIDILDIPTIQSKNTNSLTDLLSTDTSQTPTSTLSIISNSTQLSQSTQKKLQTETPSHTSMLGFINAANLDSRSLADSSYISALQKANAESGVLFASDTDLKQSHLTQSSGRDRLALLRERMKSTTNTVTPTPTLSIRTLPQSSSSFVSSVVPEIKQETHHINDLVLKTEPVSESSIRDNNLPSNSSSDPIQPSVSDSMEDVDDMFAPHVDNFIKPVLRARSLVFADEDNQDVSVSDTFAHPISKTHTDTPEDLHSLQLNFTNEQSNMPYIFSIGSLMKDLRQRGTFTKLSKTSALISSGDVRGRAQDTMTDDGMIYYDQQGKQITANEQFRLMSRSFHGTNKSKTAQLQEKHRNVNMKSQKDSSEQQIKAERRLAHINNNKFLTINEDGKIGAVSLDRAKLLEYKKEMIEKNKKKLEKK